MSTSLSREVDMEVEVTVASWNAPLTLGQIYPTGSYSPMVRSGVGSPAKLECYLHFRLIRRKLTTADFQCDTVLWKLLNDNTAYHMTHEEYVMELLQKNVSSMVFTLDR